MKERVHFRRLFLLVVLLVLAGNASAQSRASSESEPIPDLEIGQAYQGVLRLNDQWSNLWPFHYVDYDLHLFFDEGDSIPYTWLLNSYFKSAPDQRILDPQKYLTAQDEAVIIDILKTHDENSQIPIILYVFGKVQNTGEITPEKVCSDFLADEHAAVVFYFMGDAPAVKGYIKLKSSNISENSSSSKPLFDEFEVKTMFARAGFHAHGQNTDPREALYSTIAEISQRMYWIERDLGLAQVNHEVIDDYRKPQSVETSSSLAQWMTDYLGEDWRGNYHLGGVLVASFFAVLAFMLCLYNKFKVLKFPKHQRKLRLGAKQGAGLGEVVSYASTSESLQDQIKLLKNDEL